MRSAIAIAIAATIATGSISSVQTVPVVPTAALGYVWWDISTGQAYCLVHFNDPICQESNPTIGTVEVSTEETYRLEDGTPIPGGNSSSYTMMTTSQTGAPTYVPPPTAYQALVQAATVVGSAFGNAIGTAYQGAVYTKLLSLGTGGTIAAGAASALPLTAAAVVAGGIFA